ncbi:plasmid mobilization protein [Flavobacterium sp. FlaQc-57]|uniref:plasmid mobilization protein n=1 Tax=Flavobacterium sp. FlaQc-57 TaxID=3374186 RepID=UPI003757E500
MEPVKNNRTKWLHLRLNADEFELIQKQFKKTTCRKLSDFARKNLLQKPMVLKYRNQSLDELIQELIQLRFQLNAVGNNFNQSVKKLHTIAEISDLKKWMTAFESDKKGLFETVEKIKTNIENLSQKWLQS